MTPYRYISIEGNIGAGKTTLTQKLAHDYQAKLVLEEFADNPFLPKFYKNPERYAFPVELSFLSERYAQFKREMNSADLFAPVILSDYFIGKCQIFAKNNLTKEEYDLFLKMYEIVESNCPKPDLLVYLYLDTEALLNNIRKRGRTYEQEITATYLSNIQKQYLEFIRQHDDMRILILNTTSLDFVQRPEDYLRIKSLLEREYDYGIHRL